MAKKRTSQRRRFDREIKDQAVRMLLDGHSAPSVAPSLFGAYQRSSIGAEERARRAKPGLLKRSPFSTNIGSVQDAEF